MYAWRARDVIGLPDGDRDLIADRVSRCARGRVLPLPERAPEPDQLELRAVRAPRDGHRRQRAARQRLPRAGRALRDGIKQRRDAAAARPTSARATASTTCPHRPPTHPFNLDSAEYASETFHFILLLRAGPAGRHGAAAPEHVELLRAWVEHIVYGYWTHGGYLNWDTGYGFKRWHAGRTWALAQQGLLAIAVGAAVPQRPEIGRGRSTCSTAGWGCTSASRERPPDGKGIAPSNLYDIERSLRSAPASASCSRRACRQTRRARWRSGWGRCPPPSHLRCTRSTATSAA